MKKGLLEEFNSLVGKEVDLIEKEHGNNIVLRHPADRLSNDLFYNISVLATNNGLLERKVFHDTKPAIKAIDKRVNIHFDRLDGTKETTLGKARWKISKITFG